MLCEVLADDKQSALKITEDLGGVLKNNRLYNGFDFDWLYDSKIKRNLSFFARYTKKSENITNLKNVLTYTNVSARKNKTIWIMIYRMNSTRCLYGCPKMTTSTQ